MQGRREVQGWCRLAAMRAAVDAKKARARPRQEGAPDIGVLMTGRAAVIAWPLAIAAAPSGVAAMLAGMPAMQGQG